MPSEDLRTYLRKSAENRRDDGLLHGAKCVVVPPEGDTAARRSPRSTTRGWVEPGSRWASSPSSCLFPVRGNTRLEASGAGPPTHAVAGFVSDGGLVGGDGKTTIFGVAARDVASVEVELRDGRIVEGPLIDAPAELDTALRFFIVRLRLSLPKAPEEVPAHGLLPVFEDSVRAYSAFDGQGGRLIERVVDG